MEINNDEIQQQMQQDIKKRLENLPRFNYRVTKCFMNKTDLQLAVDDFNNNGIPNLISRKLTDNYIEEIYEMCIILKREGKIVLKAAIYGAVLGLILGIIHGKGLVSLPLFNPVSAGGAVVSAILFSGITATILAAFTAIAMIFKPIEDINKGYYILTVYSDYESKQTIDSIFNKYITFEL